MNNVIIGLFLGFLASYLAQWPPAPRQLWHRFRFNRLRGRRCYVLPGAKTHVVPCVTGSTETPYVSRYALDCVTAVTQMFRVAGWDEGHDFDVLFQEEDQDKPVDIRQENLVLICGPEKNRLVASILRDFPDLLRVVSYESFPKPCFVYRGQRFESCDTHDWALIAVKRNPYNPQRKLVLLFGLRGIGTKGAGLFYASSGAESDRLEVADSAETREGEIEVLLRVQHSKYNTITQTCPFDLLGRQGRPSHQLPVVTAHT